MAQLKLCPFKTDLLKWLLVLAHVDFGAVSLETNLIHQLVDQEDATAVVGVNILAFEGIGNLHRIETTSRISHNNKKPMLFVARDATLDLFGGIVFAAVKNGVGKCLAKGGFDLKFLAGSAIHAPRHLHNALNHRTDGGWVGVECNLDTYHQFAIKLERRKAARRLRMVLNRITCATLTGMVRAVKQRFLKMAYV